MPNDFTLTAKRPEEIIFVGFPFAPLFDSGTTITGVAVVIEVYSGLPDTQPNLDAMHSSPPAVNPDDNTEWSQKITGGQVGTTYKISATATGNRGSVNTVSWNLPVDDTREG